MTPKPLFIFSFCFPQQLFYSTELNSTSKTKWCYSRVRVVLNTSQLRTVVARRLKQALFDQVWCSKIEQESSYDS